MTLFATKIDTLADSLGVSALAVDRVWADVLREGAQKPAIAVGSGGSTITAHFLAACRRTLGFPGTHIVTPLEYVLSSETPLVEQTWFFSGSGENTDIIAAFDAGVAKRSSGIVVLTSRPNGTLARKARDVQFPVLVAPTGNHKDGFLSTHTLISAVTGLLLASEQVVKVSSLDFNAAERWVARVHEIASPERRDELAREFAATTQSSVLLLLHDPRLAAAAVTLETSLWEASLCAVQRVDFRNFAHGRHVWPAKHPDQVLVLALTGFETRPMWDEINRALPDTVRRYHLDFADCGRHQCAASIATALTVVEAIGRAVGVDPAQPGVDDGGRTLFQSASLTALAGELPAPVRSKAAAIYRFDAEDAGTGSPYGCYAAYVKFLSQAEIGGLALDYDGTLVPTEKRTDPICADLASLLNQRLEQGLKVGIATGRGESVLGQLRSAIESEHQPKIIIGYYNGAVLKSLADDPQMDRFPVDPCIAAVHQWLIDTAGIPEAKIRHSAVQLTLPRSAVPDTGEFGAALRGAGHTGVRLVQSGHSIDICPAAASKTRVIDAMQLAWNLEADAILCAGDSGAPSGNDFELLGRPLGVAIGELCGRPTVAWPLFGPDVSGPEAVYRLLLSMQPSAEAGRFKLKLA